MEQESKKSILTGQQPAFLLLMTFLAFFFLLGLGAFLGGQVSHLLGVDVNEVMSSGGNRPLVIGERQALRWYNLVAHLCGFTVTALLIGLLVSGRQQIGAFFHLTTWPTRNLLAWSVVALVVGLPVIGLSSWINQLLPLPEWMTQMEDNQNWLVAEVLRMDSGSEFLLAFMVAAVAPALGEELLFRGVLQPFFQQLVRNPHWGIWLTAIVFSAIHMQFVGFIPRMLLGAFLGYLFWWSGSLWLPIILHLFFNGFQIVGTYLAPDQFKMAGEESSTMPNLFIGSLALIGLLLVLRRMAQSATPPTIA
ncbi:MAG: hypothetical protein DA408_07225 [Bacteroidetes bacterium]|nr:MAG: hypothetical protein C7N36_14745 [Bacteroidota bacterium]PTM13290.1 MAG: hypothetical protein DA408_07225 [Bacteroidota bacterium]